MNLKFSISGIFLALLFFFLFNQSSGHLTQIPLEKPSEIAALPQIIRGIDLDDGVNFAGEKMPQNFDAIERLDRELLVNSYWHSSTMLNLKASERYFPLFDQILAAEGVPTDFKYIAVAESNLRNAASPAGAKGFWQIMPAVAKAYGLEINSEVDERYHIEKATTVACQLIKKYHQRFGNWTNAAAAYNIGETKFAREAGVQKMQSYYDMNFGEETNRYLFRILALKEIMKSPSSFGFYLDKDHGYHPLDTYYKITVDASVPSLGDLAKKYGTTYRMLKIYNPWLISNKLTVRQGNSYQIKIPK